MTQFETLSPSSRRLRGKVVVQGFSLFELLIVVAIVLSVAAIAYPKISNAITGITLRSSAGDLAGMMQQARTLASKNNAIYSLTFATVGGAQSAFINFSPQTSTYQNNEPILAFPATVVPASGAPSGSNGQPGPYTLSGDSSGSAFDNTHTIAFTPRGLPCDYISTTTPPTCNTPAAGYFVYYLSAGNGMNWAAVVVARGGRSKVVSWDGSTWH